MTQKVGVFWVACCLVVAALGCGMQQTDPEEAVATVTRQGTVGPAVEATAMAGNTAPTPTATVEPGEECCNVCCCVEVCGNEVQCICIEERHYGMAVASVEERIYASDVIVRAV